MEKKTVVLLTYGKAREHRHGDCVDQLRFELGAEVIQTRESRQIDITRSVLATSALAFGADVAFFIDHDIIFNPFDVEPLADVARERQGVVGAAYPMRMLGGTFSGSLPADLQEVTFFEGGDVYEAPGVIGMGFTAIHKSVFEKIAKLPDYAERNCSDGIVTPYFQKIVRNGTWLHEDASFCHAARLAGAGTFLDTRPRLQHLGEHPFSMEECGRPTVQRESLKVGLRSG
jgi:hypothetical protein